MAFDDTKSPGDLISSTEFNNFVDSFLSHAARHSDGGSDELDAAEFAGALGQPGQVLRSDGSTASWETISTGASVSNNGSQVVGSPDDVNYAEGLNASSDGDGSVSVAQAVIEGGGKVFVQDSFPTATQVGDVWIATGGDLP